MNPDLNRKSREAFRLASDLMMDLVAGSQAYATLQRVFDQHPEALPDHVRVAVTRLCLFHAIISLTKWTELYDRYKDVIPSDVREVAKALRMEIDQRGIVEFRNKVVGHIWDDALGRALTNDEVEERLTSLTRSDVKGFLEWVNNTRSDDNSATAVAAVEAVRDRIREVYGLTDADLHR